VGAAAYLSQRLRPGDRRTDELGRVTEEVVREAERLRTWAERRGVRLPGTDGGPAPDREGD
jgi:hypothetical protein